MREKEGEEEPVNIDYDKKTFRGQCTALYSVYIRHV